MSICLDKDSIKLIQDMQACEKAQFLEYGNYGTRVLEGLLDHKTFTSNVRKQKHNFKVSNIKSFITFVKEELNRRNNPEGSFASVTFDNEGGHFFADDDFCEGACIFERSLSQQWQVLSGIVNKTLDHESFLHALCALKASIPMFNELYHDYARLRIIGKSELNSEPTFFQGESTNGYKIKHTIARGSSGDEEEDCVPADFSLSIPYAKNSSRHYCVNIETLFVNSQNNKIAIKILCPEFEQIEEQAILDEVKLFREELKEASKLLILENF